MTDEMIRRQKADLLLELKETQDHLNVLRDKAKTMFQAVDEFKGAFYAKAQIGSHYGDRAGIIASDKYREALNFDNLSALLAEIERDIATLRDLEQRKKDLGLA